MEGPEIARRYDALVSTRKNLDDVLQVIEKYVVPYRGEFFRPLDSEHEVEWRRRHIYDSTALVAADLLASQIHANLTSPSIRWFELRFRRSEVNDQQTAKEWLDKVQTLIWQALLESDFNMEIAETYMDLVSFGTAVLFEEEMSEERWEGVTFTALPIRSTYYEHAADSTLARIYRCIKYTNLQMLEKFGDKVKPLLQEVGEGEVDKKEKVIFCIYKNPDYQEPDETDGEIRTLAGKAREFRYKYVLHRTGDVLDEGGYYEMPAFVARWKKVAGSVWGHSPAFVALSDILQLNQVVAQVSEARSKEVDPPMKSTERGLLGDLDLNPGGLTMVLAMDELDRLLAPNAQLFQGDVEIERLQQSIRSTFFIDKLELKESPAMTATEVMVRYQRMQRQFAPTLGRLQADLLDPLIEMTYRVLERNGRLPPIPRGLEQEELDIEYIGPIPRAQKNEEAQAISLWAGELAGLAQVMPALLDVPDTDAIARQLGLSRGVPAKLMNSEADVKRIRKERAEQQAKAEQAALMQGMGSAMQELGKGAEAMGEITE